MKKLIAILMVLAIVAGFAFADPTPAPAKETHTVLVKADVTEVAPVFALRLGADGVITNVTAGPDETTHQYTNAFADGGDYKAASNDTDAERIDVGFNLDEGGTVTVYARLLNPAKQIKTYHLEFSDGKFEVTEKESPVTIEPTITTSADLDVTGVATSLSADTGAEGGTNNKIVSVVFNGQPVAAATDLASAVYSYAAHPDVDLKDTEDGFYYADIVLTVSAT